MNVTFIKDSLNIHEDDYIVDVYFKDKNDTNYYFFIDSDDEPSIVSDLETPEEVKEIKIEVKNDFNINPFIAIVPKIREQAWQIA